MLRFKLATIALALTLCGSIGFGQNKLELTELQKLKAENFQLKVQLTQCSANLLDSSNKLQSIQLTAEQSELVKEFRIQLHADEKDTFDWSTLTFKSISGSSK